jgi:hypothetical protein
MASPDHMLPSFCLGKPGAPAHKPEGQLLIFQSTSNSESVEKSLAEQPLISLGLWD